MDQSELLLREYEICQDASQKLEATIWQTSAIIGIGSIGSFVVVTNHSLDDQPPFLISLLICIVFIVASWIWWHMARRWWSIQHAKYLRMRHIEKELGIYQARYIEYLDDLSKLQDSNLANELQGELMQFQDYQKDGIQKYLRLLPIFVSLAWIIYLCVRILQICPQCVLELLK